jgi:hypothetical protein
MDRDRTDQMVAVDHVRQGSPADLALAHTHIEQQQRETRFIHCIERLPLA